MSEKLIEYLASMDSTENQWTVYVNPKNLDEYICTQWDSPWVPIGTPERLSFGFILTTEVLESHLLGTDDTMVYKGRKTRFDRKGLISAYSDGRLDEAFNNWLMEEIQPTRRAMALAEAEVFVYDRIPEIIEQHQSSEEYESFQ